MDLNKIASLVENLNDSCAEQTIDGGAAYSPFALITNGGNEAVTFFGESVYDYNEDGLIEGVELCELVIERAQKIIDALAKVDLRRE